MLFIPMAEGHVNERRARNGGLRGRLRGLSGETRRLLASEGGPERFDFNETPDALTTSVLVAAANAAALDGLQHVSILVGARVARDPSTHVVTGQVIGIEAVDTAHERIVRLASEISPNAPDVSVYVENLKTSKPILRLQIRPTRPPHRDALGAWVARPGAPVRPLTESELLELRLGAEGQRLAETLTDLATGFGERISGLAGALEALEERVRLMEQTGRDALNATNHQQTILGRLEQLMTAARLELASLGTPTSFEAAWWELNGARTRGWAAFERKRSPAFRAGTILREILETHADPLDYERNLLEGQAWNALAALPEDAPASAWAECAEMIRSAAEGRHRVPQLGLASRIGSVESLSVTHP